ncbi:MAG: nitronate monooxygenase [Gammaproteobacteria bacterium]|nr:nitronate monooxygenase [Gammaproteobacteria bacterium]
MQPRPLILGRTPIAKPIIQAPIGSLASTALVAAVSNAGGVGALALTWVDAAAARRLVSAVRARTSAPFIANFVLSFSPSSLPAALEAGAPVVTFSWGLPGVALATVHSFGAVAGVQVGTLEGAKRALDEGCDFLICQGVEAGGHVQSSLPLALLLQEVIAAAGDTPVVAAGGLADGADIAATIAAGASGVMLGTRFVASAESAAHSSYKAALLSAASGDTVLTGCFDGGWPYALHRVLRNTTLTEWESAGCPPVGRRPGEGDTVARLESGQPVRRYEDAPPSAAMQGDVLACCLYAGTGVGKITAIREAGELVGELWREAQSVLAAGAPPAARAEN